MMNLCIPYNSIERIGGKLSANSWVAYGRRQATPETIQQISRAVCTSLVQLNVRLAQTQIGTGELIGLRVGDIITTQKDVHSPVIVSVEGIPKFRARPGAFKGHKAVLHRRRDREPGGSAGAVRGLAERAEHNRQARPYHKTASAAAIPIRPNRAGAGLE